MKNLTKIASVILAAFFVLSFASCQNDSSDKTVVASFAGNVQGEDVTVTFYEDKTLSWGGLGGTYTGDVSSDGTGTITLDEIEGEVMKYDWELKGDKITIGQYFLGTVMGFTLTRK